MKALDLLDQFRLQHGLEWVAVNFSNLSGQDRLLLAPYDNGIIPREELMRREIPVTLIIRAQKLFPRATVVVRGLVTEQEIKAEQSWFNYRAAACGD